MGFTPGQACTLHMTETAPSRRPAVGWPGPAARREACNQPVSRALTTADLRTQEPLRVIIHVLPSAAKAHAAKTHVAGGRRAVIKVIFAMSAPRQAPGRLPM
jgi:hypothetical protein